MTTVCAVPTVCRHCGMAETLHSPTLKQCPNQLEAEPAYYTFEAISLSRSTVVCRHCGSVEASHSPDDKRCMETATPKRVHVVSYATGNITQSCGVCHRTRAQCTRTASCRRIRNNDPLHESLHVAAEFIAETRYFGREALETAGEMIQAARCEAFRKAANREMDGFLLKRIDEDSERLFARAKGKLYGTVLKLQERDTASSAPYRSISRQQSNAEVIAQFKRNTRAQVA